MDENNDVEIKTSMFDEETRVVYDLCRLFHEFRNYILSTYCADDAKKE